MILSTMRNDETSVRNGESFLSRGNLQPGDIQITPASLISYPPFSQNLSPVEQTQASTRGSVSNANPTSTPNSCCGVTAGQIYIDSSTSYRAQCDVNLQYGDLRTALLVTFSQCLQRCTATSLCAAIVYNPFLATCNLKNTVGQSEAGGGLCVMAKEAPDSSPQPISLATSDVLDPIEPIPVAGLPSSYSTTQEVVVSTSIGGSLASQPTEGITTVASPQNLNALEALSSLQAISSGLPYISNSLNEVFTSNLGLGLPSTSSPNPPFPTDTKRVSPNGLCGIPFGYTCEGSAFGSCCGAGGICGNDELHCSRGCNPQYGLCGSVTISRADQFPQPGPVETISVISSLISEPAQKITSTSVIVVDAFETRLESPITPIAPLTAPSFQTPWISTGSDALRSASDAAPAGPESTVRLTIPSQGAIGIPVQPPDVISMSSVRPIVIQSQPFVHVIPPLQATEILSRVPGGGGSIVPDINTPRPTSAPDIFGDQAASRTTTSVFRSTTPQSLRPSLALILPPPSLEAPSDVPDINIGAEGKRTRDPLQASMSFTTSQPVLVVPYRSPTTIRDILPTLDAILDAIVLGEPTQIISHTPGNPSARPGRATYTRDTAGVNTPLPMQFLSSITRPPYVTPSGGIPGGRMEIRPGVFAGPVYTPIASLPWWDWNDPSEGGDGLPDDEDHQYWDNEDDGSDDKYDEEGVEDGQGDWDTNDEDGNRHGDGYESGDGYEVAAGNDRGDGDGIGVGNEHGDGYEAEVGNEQKDDGGEDQCDCGCDWWWTDDEDNSGEGVDWEWVNEDVVSWNEEDGTCNWRPVLTPTPTPPLVSDARAKDYDTGAKVVPPESTISDSTSNHGYNIDHATPAYGSQHDKPQSWHDGNLRTGLHHDEDDPNKEWSDGALYHA
ncbi:hypothetical protein PMIN02_011272 [Paraphaeosphaeria minitans]